MQYCFGDYILDTQRRELSHQGHGVALRPKVFDVLAYLVLYHDHVVSKQALLTALWPHVQVSPAALSACIKLARQAVGDSGATQQIIQTYHGRGYRFVASVQAREHPPAADPMPPRDHPPGQGHAHASPPALGVGATLAYPSVQPLPMVDGEYKPVTVLCCDVAEALPVAVRRHSEVLYRWMQTVFGLALEVVGDYEGTLLHQTSAGVTAVFGAPVAQEDHARRAVWAALALSQRLHAALACHPQTSGGGLGVRMGLHSDLGVVGVLGHAAQQHYTVIGEPTALATCLQQQAAPGTILLSAATYRLVSEEVRVEPVPALVQEGRPLSGQGYRLVECRRRESDGAGQGRRVWGPLVGRAQECILLRERWAAACAGQGQIVSLVGEAGLGKTRLLTECCRQLWGPQVPVYVGQCLSYGRSIPYHPVRALVRQLCGIAAGHEPAASRAMVRQRLQDAAIVAEADVALMCQVLDLPVAPEALVSLPPESRQARTGALLRHLILHAAQQQPLVLAVENLQWSDALSEAWLASLVTQLAGVTLLLLVTYRPEYQPPWGAHVTTTQVVLSPLNTRDSWTIVQSLPQAARLLQARRQEIVATAAGNPFFLEELAWHTADAASPTPRLVVPATVHAVLAARLDRLPPDAKALLQTAAVLGPTIPVALLRALAVVPEETLQRSLAHLQAMAFLTETQVVPEATYTFQHTLSHEVTYRSLLQERRQALHARCLEVLEKRSGDHGTEQVEHLAYHALRGHIPMGCG